MDLSDFGQTALQLEAGPITSLAFSPSRQELAIGTPSGPFVADYTWHWVPHRTSITAVSYSPCGQMLATAGMDATVRLWQRTGESLPEDACTFGHPDAVRALAFHPDGLLLASGGDDTRVQVWNTHSGDRIAEWNGRCIDTVTVDAVTSLAFCLRGQRLAIGLRSGLILLWDFETQDPPLICRGHRGAVTALAYSPKSGVLVSGSEDKFIHIWDVSSPDQHAVVGEHAAGITDVAFHPEGHVMASASKDGTVQVWDPATGQATHVFCDHTDGTGAVAFSPNGLLFASGGGDGLVDFRHLPSWRLNELVSSMDG